MPYGTQRLTETFVQPKDMNRLLGSPLRLDKGGFERKTKTDIQWFKPFKQHMTPKESLYKENFRYYYFFPISQCQLPNIKFLNFSG